MRGRWKWIGKKLIRFVVKENRIDWLNELIKLNRLIGLIGLIELNE